MGLALNDDRLTTRVGAVVLLLVMVAGVLVLTLDTIHLRAGLRFTVYFEHLGALKEGAEVQAASKVIGEVKSVRFLAKNRLGPNHPLSKSGGVAVHVRIDKRYRHMLPINGDYFVSSKGLFSMRYLEIGAPRGGAAPDRPIEEGDQIRGIDPPRVDRVLQRSYENLMSTAMFARLVFPEWRALVKQLDILSGLLDQVEPHPGAIADARRAVNLLIDEVSVTRDKWSRAGVTAADIRRLTARARRTMAVVDASFSEIGADVADLRGRIAALGARVPKDLRKRFDLALRRTEGSMKKLQHTVALMRQMQAMVERGEGNIGALANDPEFSDDTKKLGKILKSKPWRIIAPPQN